MEETKYKVKPHRPTPLVPPSHITPPHTILQNLLEVQGPLSVQEALGPRLQ